MDMLDLRHEPSWAMWRNDLRCNDPPPFLGPLVTIKEAAEALVRSIGYVRDRINDGRLNVWKDPISKRVWILKDDLDILIGDNRALEEKAASRPKRPKNPNPQSTIHNPQSEDLDAIGGWEHPKPPEIIGGAAIEESARESNLRYEQKQRENEEWYAAELAKLEDRDPEEAVRQLQIERGWLTPEPASPEPTYCGHESTESVYAIIKPRASPKRTRDLIRPVSYSNPNPRPRTPPEPYIDPDLVEHSPGEPIVPPFPVGWINKHEAANVLQVTPRHFNKLARNTGLQRRKLPGAREYLYDSLEVEQFAERRLDQSCKINIPGKRLNWWGSRAKPMKLRDFDYWITTAEAAQILGVSPNRIGRMCDRGLLPCKQAKPGVPGSRIYVPHCAVFKVSQREEYQNRRRIQKASSRTRSRAAGGNEEWDLMPFDPSEPSPGTRINHGEYLTTRQSAQALGVGIGSVNRLRLRGRLPATRLHPKKQGTAKNPWWFFRRQDVDNLLADHEYRKRAAKGKKAQHRT